MIKLENTETVGWEAAIRGMRNPMNSWDRIDSKFIKPNDTAQPHILIEIGSNDYDLMMRLAKAGSVHAKYRRMIIVYTDITAPLYWWKEFDTYKVGTVANSCSTMHKIADKEFVYEDFSYEKLINSVNMEIQEQHIHISPMRSFSTTLECLNAYRELYLKTNDKKYWWQMIQLLPSSYNQRRTVAMNYEVLANIYKYRKNHKLDEWNDFCKWIEDLPYSEIIIEGNI